MHQVSRQFVMLLAAAGGMALLTAPAWSQITELQTADLLYAGTRVNFFAGWSGDEAADGFQVDLPLGYSVQDGALLRYGYEAVPVTVRRVAGAENRYHLAAARPLRGPHELVLAVEVSGEVVRYQDTWALTPLVRRGPDGWQPQAALRRTASLRVRAAAPVTDNHALAFGPSATPLLLRARALPSVGTRSAYTLEFWMQTVGLNEVVLSSWNGDEQVAYPLEFVVGPNGRLLFFRGQPGRHQSMTTRRPVADGAWHHIALTNDPVGGWMRLYLDGQPVDSLFSAVPLDLSPAGPLALGGRLPNPRDRQLGEKAYSGALDEVRLWPQVRRAAALQARMRQPFETPPADVVVLDFEREVPGPLVERAARGARRRTSDLAFFHPVRELRAQDTGEAVVLSWQTQDQQTDAFVVERSSDGARFEEVGRVRIQEAPADEAAQGRYIFTDLQPDGQVLFYRVRQRFASGADRLSATIKLGRGVLPERPTLLVRNYPNPFHTTTTIVYELEEAQHVALSVANLSGQQVARLVDEVREAGRHEVLFSADDLPSGIYFVRLETAAGVETLKITLSK